MRSNILSVRQAAGALRAALLTPSLEGIDAVMPALQQAAATLEQMKAQIQTQPQDASCRAELQALAGELRAVARLAAQGLDIARGTLRLLAGSASSYRPDGEPAPLPHPGTVLVRG